MKKGQHEKWKGEGSPTEHKTWNCNMNTRSILMHMWYVGIGHVYPTHI